MMESEKILDIFHYKKITELDLKLHKLKTQEINLNKSINIKNSKVNINLRYDLDQIKMQYYVFKSTKNKLAILLTNSNIYKAIQATKDWNLKIALANKYWQIKQEYLTFNLKNYFKDTSNVLKLQIKLDKNQQLVKNLNYNLNNLDLEINKLELLNNSQTRATNSLDHNISLNKTYLIILLTLKIKFLHQKQILLNQLILIIPKLRNFINKYQKFYNDIIKKFIEEIKIAINSITNLFKQINYPYEG
ncbi:hypothetical protein SERIO_v1c11920 [Spiroplasma eriocheiris]|uniref:Uncharacterized protein n=2 Tax=Spiroplasma eriocheiris TaxID=315358 RepID=A0A0H3XLD6_9MOLU|nr:hypothetical protein [Spiroplasma eriocheiris]AKM54741.1 hypothetical protein SERIO_v1c11920 [Spiroplasma eriocheiris]